MTNRRQLKIALCAAVALLVMVGLDGAGRDASAQSSSSLRNRRAANRDRREQVQDQLVITKQKQHYLLQELGTARGELRGAQRRLKAAQDRLASTRAELRAVREKHDQAKQRLDEQNAAFGARLEAFYKRGPTTYLAVVLDAEDFTDFVARSYLAQYVIEEDAALLAQIEAERNRLAQYQVELQELEAKQASTRTRIAQEAEIERRQAARVSQAKASVDAQRRRLESQLAQVEAESRLIEDMLRGRRPTYRGPSSWSGKWLMPIAGGRVGSGFGMRYHPILHYWRMHYGVDIGARSGTPIRAAERGLVIYAGWRGGYGNTVMLDHGGGVVTVYAHCSRLGATVGQTVARGQTIAYVGSTGLSTGPHLHFEVRRNGAAVDPLRE